MVSTISNGAREVSPTPVALIVELTILGWEWKGVGPGEEGEQHPPGV